MRAVDLPSTAGSSGLLEYQALWAQWTALWNGDIALKDTLISHGDIADVATVDQALHGMDAAISTLGGWANGDSGVLQAGMRVLIPAMRRAGISRIVTLTGAGAQWAGDSMTLELRLNRMILGLMQRAVLADGETTYRGAGRERLGLDNGTSPYHHALRERPRQARATGPLPDDNDSGSGCRSEHGRACRTSCVLAPGAGDSPG